MIMNQQATNFPWRQLGYLTIIAGLLTVGPIFEMRAKTGANVVGTLDANAQGEIPKGAAIAVHATSGAPEVQAIAERFREGLEETGYQAVADGVYILRFQISSDSPDSGRGTRLELRGDRGSSSSGEVDLTMRWNMRRGEASPTRRGRRILVSVEDADQNEIWQARVELQVNDADDITLVDVVMPALMANFGRTVYALRVP